MSFSQSTALLFIVIICAFTISYGLPRERDVEPLAPDYQDPKQNENQKPVLVPKAKPAKKQPNPSNTFNPLIPDGVVDVDVHGGTFDPLLGAGFGSSSPEADFGFHTFNLNSQPGLFSFGSFFGTDLQPWWKGPNVCVERQESTEDEDSVEQTEEVESKKNKTESPSNGESLDNPLKEIFSTSIRLSNCQETANKYECITKVNKQGVIKTFAVTYKCCYGFKRQPGSNGCTKQVELKPLLDTLDDFKCTEFKRLISDDGGFEGRLNSGNFTIFAPTDAGLNDFNEHQMQMNNVDGVGNDGGRRRHNSLPTNELVENHVVAGFIDLAELGNEEILYSENNNSTLRINVYPSLEYERTVTVNCARVKKANNLAKNGIVHVMENVVPPATLSIREIINEHPKLTNLREVLDKTDIYTKMKPNGHYTFFAPTDEAFDKLDEVQRKKILRGEACADSILKHHITAHTVCSSAIVGQSTTHNVEGQELALNRNENDELTFEDKARITEADIIAKDGVIHLIDTLIIPNSALYIGDVLKTHNLSKFEDLVAKAGLSDEINGLTNATVFAPSNRAFERPETKKMIEELENDPEKLQDFIRYHTVQGQLQSCDMSNNQRLQTRDNNKELRINLYSAFPLFATVTNRATANCARIRDYNEKACGSVVHEVDRVLVPPEKSILELIEEDDRYSTLREMMQGTEIPDLLKDSNKTITFLAPTDETFAAVDEDYKKQLISNKELAGSVLKNHILTEVLCCSGVHHTWSFNQFVPTLAHQRVEVARYGSKVRVNRAIITSCDNLAINGVMHTINKILIPQQPVNANFGGFFLFDF